MADTPSHPDAPLRFELFTTSFCGACRQTRAVLQRALELLPGSTLSEHDVAFEPELAEREGIEETPTTIIRGPDGRVLHRSGGVPTLPQVLVAAATALEATSAE